MGISDQLRRAIRGSGLSLNQIARAAGISHPMLSFFLSKKPDQRRDIRLATADKLATFFGMKLTEPAGKAKPAGAKKSTASPARRPAKKKPKLRIRRG